MIFCLKKKEKERERERGKKLENSIIAKSSESFTCTQTINSQTRKIVLQVHSYLFLHFSVFLFFLKDGDGRSKIQFEIFGSFGVGRREEEKKRARGERKGRRKRGKAGGWGRLGRIRKCKWGDKSVSHRFYTVE